MYTLKENKSYHIHNHIIYEDDVPIIHDRTEILPDWMLWRKDSKKYIQSRLTDLSRRFDKINQVNMKYPIKKFFYDVETTGLNPNRCSIHQLSAIIEIDGEVVEKLTLYIKPHEKAVIEQSALTLCKVTEEQIQAYPSMEEQFKVLCGVLSKYVDPFQKNDKFYFVGFKNASFDDEFIKKYFDLMQSKFFFYFFANSIDVSCLAAEYLINRRWNMPSFKLLRVAKELGIYVEDEEAHDSDYDVMVTRKIYRIVTRLEDEGLC